MLTKLNAIMEFQNASFFANRNNHSELRNFENFAINLDFTSLKIYSQGITRMLVLFVLCLVFFLRNFRRGNGFIGNYISYTRQMPYAKLTPIGKLLPVLNDILLHHRLRRDGVQAMENLATKYGPTFRLSGGVFQCLAVSDPTVIQKLLSSTKPGHLEKPKYIYHKLLTDLVKDGLLSSKYEIWSPHRKACNFAMKYKGLSNYLEFIIEGAKDIVKESCDIASLAGNGEICNNKMKEITVSHVLKIIAKIIMGSEAFNLSDEEWEKFHSSFRRLKDISLERFHRLEFFIPIIWWLHPLRREEDRVIKEIRSFSNQMTDICLKRNAAEMMKSRCELPTKENSTGMKPLEFLLEKMISSGFSKKEISDEVSMFLIGGHETILIALDMLIFHLAGNTEHQISCRDEVDEFFISKIDDDHSISKLNLEDFTQLKYLERCILESLRLTPTVPFFLRELHEPLEVEENMIVEAGESVVVMPWILHRNPEIYPDPEVFNPERFLPENVKQRHSHSFIPFSMGPRNCIGWKIALLELKVIMTWILRHFEMTTTDKPVDVKLLFDITLKPERNYDVTFKKRQVIIKNS